MWLMRNDRDEVQWVTNGERHGERREGARKLWYRCRRGHGDVLTRELRSPKSKPSLRL